jgi:hypothetical protein
VRGFPDAAAALGQHVKSRTPRRFVPTKRLNFLWTLVLALQQDQARLVPMAHSRWRATADAEGHHCKVALVGGFHIVTNRNVVGALAPAIRLALHPLKCAMMFNIDHQMYRLGQINTQKQSCYLYSKPR